MGLNSGIAGTYLPYCRILNQSLSACEWSDMARQHNSHDAGRPAAVPEIMVNEIRSLFEVNLLSPFGQSLATRKHAAGYDTLVSSGREMAVDPRLNLTLLHFPIPHWPYFYNRKTGKYDLENSLKTGYFDALVLADGALGTLRRDLEDAGLWDSTTVLVSSDHSHRSAARGIDGKSNPRIPFLLKLAGQTTGVQFPAEFNTVLTKELLLSILKRQISTPQQAVEWLHHHRSVGQSPYDDDI
jgi:arylsulfatase A-like enzyme